MMEVAHGSSIHRQRTVVLRAVLMLTVVFAGAFGLLNLYRGMTLLASVELAVALFSLAMLLGLPRSRNPERWSLIYLVVFFTMLVTALVTPRLSDTVFVWILVIPLLAHFLQGRALGLVLSLTFLAMAWVVYLVRFPGEPMTLVDYVGFGNIVASSLVLTGLTHAYEYAREQAEKQLRMLAATDSLTGLPNRKRLKEVLEHVAEQSRRLGTGFSLLGMDLDHFKGINDRYGHDVGDQVLCRLSEILRGRLRSIDTPARWGGEEFFVLLPGTDAAGARHIAETIRAELASSPVTVEGEVIAVTISIGIAEFPGDGAAISDLLVCADRRLYAAKEAGRNRVVAEHPELLEGQPIMG
ncbi:GGDEF domain-containing protein [Vreelandella utahensis]|uniref:GGDEF domain-containing protein n=1 Tax=Vreelandella halophila TaxID=86177 RepID=UPI00098711E3|nr:GGDEF domain-containing protein [Halomonas utahensis]